MINVNMNKAREIHKDNIRAARKPLLEVKDVEFQRALETGADTSTIVSEKQSLRDATINPDIAAASTPEELKASWDSDLLGDSPYT